MSQAQPTTEGQPGPPGFSNFAYDRGPPDGPASGAGGRREIGVWLKWARTIFSFVITVIFIRIYGVHTVLKQGNYYGHILTVIYLRSYTVCIYGSGQPYVWVQMSAKVWISMGRRMRAIVWCMGTANERNAYVGPWQEGEHVCRVGQNHIYMHRIFPYIWLFPCPTYRIYTVYIWF
jgi:hypothetical protein